MGRPGVLDQPAALRRAAQRRAADGHDPGRAAARRCAAFGGAGSGVARSRPRAGAGDGQRNDRRDRPSRPPAVGLPDHARDCRGLLVLERGPAAVHGQPRGDGRAVAGAPPVRAGAAAALHLPFGAGPSDLSPRCPPARTRGIPDLPERERGDSIAAGPSNARARSVRSGSTRARSANSWPRSRAPSPNTSVRRRDAGLVRRSCSAAGSTRR